MPNVHVFVSGDLLKSLQKTKCLDKIVHASQIKASTNKLKVSKLNFIVLNVCHPILQVAVFSRSIQIALPCVTYRIEEGRPCIFVLDFQI